MLGKFAITISFIVIYVITAEMFPTSVRHSMVSYSSTFGRIGSILAPQTPLLVSLSVPQLAASTLGLEVDPCRTELQPRQDSELDWDSVV